MAYTQGHDGTAEGAVGLTPLLRIFNTTAHDRATPSPAPASAPTSTGSPLGGIPGVGTGQGLGAQGPGLRAFVTVTGQPGSGTATQVVSGRRAGTGPLTEYGGVRQAA
ncbi:hypothetical protein AB0L59_28375 [Streptomyces sp. NPDC052109]|uniref:hypothetical protein n=1 Tax=Streptomyces sp. NPDC052109 TaxID=3155527 RepID=UPI003443EF34